MLVFNENIHVRHVVRHCHLHASLMLSLDKSSSHSSAFGVTCLLAHLLLLARLPPVVKNNLYYSHLKLSHR